MRYAPLFSGITDSSLWEEPLHVRVLFITMFANKQPDHVVYADVWRLRKWSNLTYEETEDALKILESPDARRPGQEFEGRRIEKVEGGWLVLNGQKYEDLMRKLNERARKAKWAREQREKARITQSTNPPETSLKDVNDSVDNGHISQASRQRFVSDSEF